MGDSELASSIDNAAIDTWFNFSLGDNINGENPTDTSAEVYPGQSLTYNQLPAGETLDQDFLITETVVHPSISAFSIDGNNGDIIGISSEKLGVSSFLYLGLH